MRIFVNACVHVGEGSRTKELAEHYLNSSGGYYETIDISSGEIKGLSESELKERSELVDNGDYSDSMFSMAKKIALADEIVIAAPYWDLSFPAALKAFVERIFVQGITFDYINDRPSGLCRGKRIVYITTAGGYIGENNFGGEYIEGSFKFLGVESFIQYQAEGLDVIGNDSKQILEKAKSAIIV
ncbi:MAG TPA: NAD(P)H-dependent oxidoreductase [Anaerovoracaceae bacterium]|nr:NAD(P)H-dependent oxidoreductase [Anaerovoracaceae bacterium]